MTEECKHEIQGIRWFFEDESNYEKQKEVSLCCPEMGRIFICLDCREVTEVSSKEPRERILRERDRHFENNSMNGGISGICMN